MKMKNSIYMLMMVIASSALAQDCYHDNPPKEKFDRQRAERDGFKFNMYKALASVQAVVGMCEEKGGKNFTVDGKTITNIYECKIQVECILKPPKDYPVLPVDLTLTSTCPFDSIQQGTSYLFPFTGISAVTDADGNNYAALDLTHGLIYPATRENLDSVVKLCLYQSPQAATGVGNLPQGNITKCPEVPTGQCQTATSPAVQFRMGYLYVLLCILALYLN